jgi:hypothetical protein
VIAGGLATLYRSVDPIRAGTLGPVSNGFFDAVVRRDEDCMKNQKVGDLNDSALTSPRLLA